MASAVYNSRLHRTTRDYWRPIVAAGEAQCAEVECLADTRAIDPDQPWDLAHGDTPNTYRGPAHPACNRSEGGRRGHAASCRNPRHNHQTPEPPVSSQDW